MNTKMVEITTNQAKQTIDALRPIWGEIEKLIETELTDRQKLSLTVCLDHLEKIMQNQLALLQNNLTILKGLKK